ncbi:MAG: 8-amino-7-oxononanoate synthase [Betaproteobacteria bacterium]|nr:8-amino-7-oxononanoate synthase [Betaproteobacteria bacterium]
MLHEHLTKKLDALAERHLTRVLRAAASPTSPHQTVRRADGIGQERLMFCSNDYLGLAAHPRIAQALAEGAQIWAGGSGASHLISGHTLAHEHLENRLSSWYCPHIPNARVLSFSTGYMANLAVTTALGDAEAEFFSDELNHASLIDGMRLAKAPVRRYAHADMTGLRDLLVASTAKIKLIVSDTIFSMDGDVGPLPTLLQLAEEHDAWLVLDDAHGFGVLGERGRGALEHFGLSSERIILVGTMGKAAGLSGAFVAAHACVIEYLIQAARTYIFTTASLPAVSHALQTSLDLIEGEVGQQRRRHLLALQHQLRDGLSQVLQRHAHLGWQLTPSTTPVQPLIVGPNEATMVLSSQLEAAGLRVPGIRPPTVPQGQARLRMTLCATHTANDIDRLVHAVQAAAHVMERT